MEAAFMRISPERTITLMVPSQKPPRRILLERGLTRPEIRVLERAVEHFEPHSVVDLHPDGTFLSCGTPD